MSYVGKLPANGLLTAKSTGTNQVLNPQLFATVSAQQITNVTGDGTNVIVVCDTIEYQQGGNNYDNTTGIFTCPIDGFYVVNGAITWQNVGVGHTRSQINIQNTGLAITTQIEGNPAASRSNGNVYTQVSTIANFYTAGTTLQLAGFVGGSTKTVGYLGSFFGQWTYFNVYRIS